MSDNVAITAGSGTSIATDDVSTVHYQKVKLVDGTADSSTAIAGDATNGLDVDVTRVPTDPFGANADSASATGSISAKLRFIAATGIPVTGTVTTTATAAGDIAHDAADSGNPIKVGAKAANALPTAVANADRANAIADLFGRLLVAHIDPAMQVTKSFNATSTQTGTDVWSPTSGKKIAVTSVVIGVYGTTSGRIILWFGDNADTTYTAGTDQLLLAFSAAPSTTSKPFLVFTPDVPVFCTTADRELHITTDAAVSIDIAVHGYEW